MSGYPVNPLRWHPTLAGGSLLLVLVVLVLNILTIAFKFIESRGEAWSPVRASSPYRQAAMRTPSEDTLRNRAATTASPGMTATMSPLGRASAAKPFILRGSPMRKDLPMINDRAGLSRFLDDSERRLDQISASSATGRDSLSASLATAASAAPTITRFQPAVKPAANLVAKEVIEDGLVVRDPAKTLREWKAEPFIDEWAESTRKVATASGELLHIRSPLEQQNAANAAAAAAAAKKPAGFGLFGGPGQTSMFPAAAPAQPQPPAIPQTLQQLADGHASNATARSRVALERYLAVGKYTCREYILDRIKSLLLDFYPLDLFLTFPQLVMHLFCRYLDELTNTLEPHKISGFSDKHFLPVGAKPVAVAAVMIREQSRWPAHYQLVVDNTIWDVYPSRNNLFHVLSLFVYAIKCLSSGFIGLLSLGGRSTRLLDIVATGPLISRFETPRKRHGQPTTGAAPAGGAAGSDSAQPIPSVVFTPVTARR
ncbi:hypothetical protein HK105_203519 [Polyrhizophydium stewartii]|uniref:Uncharacterized protein n=1 Tax=Polyrhizophydium stewartii TaxID=2732419 RepID=A0ABR4NB44_9FUNG